MHRDVKGHNILLTDQAHIKLIDFGEAEVVPPGCAHRPVGQLTRMELDNRRDLEFQAPELISGDKVGTYTDMWSFGVLLFVLLRCDVKIKILSI